MNVNSRIAWTLLALLLIGGGCSKSSSTDVAAPDSPAPAAPAPPPAASAIVGQWRNEKGTWRFQANGTFWFIGGTTIDHSSIPDVPRTEQMQGKYEVRGTNLHFTLKQHTPPEKDSRFQIDGQKLTIDGQVYEKQ